MSGFCPFGCLQAGGAALVEEGRRQGWKLPSLLNLATVSFAHKALPAPEKRGTEGGRLGGSTSPEASLPAPQHKACWVSPCLDLPPPVWTCSCFPKGRHSTQNVLGASSALAAPTSAPRQPSGSVWGQHPKSKGTVSLLQELLTFQQLKANHQPV